MKQETFLHLSSTAWTWLSAIATFLAVLVALFLPFYLEYLKEKNIINLVDQEYKININIIKDAKDSKNKDYTNLIKGTPLNIEQVILAKQIHILKNLSLNNWKDYKWNIAVNNWKKYLDFENKNKEISSLIEYYEKVANIKTFTTEQQNTIDVDFFKNTLESFKINN